MEFQDLLSKNDRVACVVTTLEPDNPVSVGRQLVDQLSLSLIAPLSAEHNLSGHDETGVPRPSFELCHPGVTRPTTEAQEN
jgi:hypothetical protein